MNRRSFLKATGLATAAVSSAEWWTIGSVGVRNEDRKTSKARWYRRVTRWGQTYSTEGFTDNSWSGLGRGSPCFCVNCQRKFRERSSQEIPRQTNWDDPLYRTWIEWNYERRTELWDINNRVTRDAGGRECLWVGM